MNHLRKQIEEQRGKLVAELQGMNTAAETRDLNEDESRRLTEISGDLEAIATRLQELDSIDKANRDAEASVRQHLGDQAPAGGATTESRDLGELYVKSGMAEQVRAYARGGRHSFEAGELRAATDPILTSGTGGLPTSYGNVLATKYRRLTIVDLLASGTLATSSLTYWTQGTLTGDVASVAEGATKPSLNFAFGQVTESLSKLAGITKVSTEMTEDAEFMVSVIRSQLQARLGIVEEDQVLNGNGTAPNLRGILNRTGIQTYATAATKTPAKVLEGIFHGANLVRTGSFIEPDGVVVNPSDYEYVRLAADSNAQYFGGGPFTGAYGNGGLQLQPGIWGLPTVVTPAIAAGTVLVGAFNTGGQFFRKGGITLDSTNSNEDDFKKNLVALRI